MKQTAPIFTKLEKLNRSKYPKFIKQILILTAFNTPAASKAINENSIRQIESAVNNNLNLLSKTEYVDKRGELKNKPFKFLIGHETLLLNFPQEIRELQTLKKSEKTPGTNQNIDQKELKILLVEKVANYIKNKKLAINIELEITNSTENRCSVKCPFCIKKIPCTFDTRWRISNLCTHILSCSKKIANRLPFQRARTDVLSEVRANIG